MDTKDKQLLDQLASDLNSASKTVVYTTHNSYKSLYIKSLMERDYTLKKAALDGIIKSSKILGLDSTKYEQEYSRLFGKRFEPKKKTAPKIIPKESITQKPLAKDLVKITKIAHVNNSIILYFDGQVSQNDVHMFELKSGKWHKDVYDIRAVLKSKVPTIKTPGIAGVRMAQNSSQKFRLVLEDRSNVQSAIVYGKNKIIIRTGSAATAAKKRKSTKKSVTKTAKKTKKRPIIKSKRNFRGKIVVIDAGHGGKDPGAIGYNKKYEKHVVLKIARYLKSDLKRRGYKVYMTRDRDKFITLRDRTKFANDKKADLFVSIHANSVKKHKRKLHGIETYFLMRARSERAKRVAATENQNAMEDMNYFSKLTFLNFLSREKIVASQKLAIDVQKNMLSNLKQRYKGVRDNGVREAPFWVLVGAQMPAVLVEVGYISNPSEERRLVKSSYQKWMARGIGDGIDSYFLKN
jgi:N-acetylmuramoyl-L-alanine amidase